MNVASPINLRASTITIRLRNISSARISYFYHTFTSYSNECGMCRVITGWQAKKGEVCLFVQNFVFSLYIDWIRGWADVVLTDIRSRIKKKRGAAQPLHLPLNIVQGKLRHLGSKELEWYAYICLLDSFVYPYYLNGMLF
jgi:hypothetical protein